jgi:hypothetical protein
LYVSEKAPSIVEFTKLSIATTSPLDTVTDQGVGVVLVGESLSRPSVCEAPPSRCGVNGDNVVESLDSQIVSEQNTTSTNDIISQDSANGSEAVEVGQTDAGMEDTGDEFLITSGSMEDLLGDHITDLELENLCMQNDIRKYFDGECFILARFDVFF